MTIKSKPLQPYQTEVVNGLKEHHKDVIVSVLSPRQYGKSYLIQMLCFQSCINHPNQVCIIVEPTLSQARKIGNEMYQSIVQTPVYKSYNSQLLELRFNNNSQILFKSVEQGSVSFRGYTISKYGYLIIDEAAYCTDELFFNITPLCSANKAPIIMFSTPRWESGVFYDYCTKGYENTYFYDWSKYKNPFISDEKLEMFRQSMPLQIFNAEYLGIWMKSESVIFGHFEAVMSNHYDSTDGLVAGIDWGNGKSAGDENSDYTAISVMNSKRQQVHLSYWNDLDETETIKRLTDIIQNMGVKKAVIERNSIGAIYLSLLKKEFVRRGVKCQIIEVNLDNTYKTEMYQDLIVNVQNKTIQLLDDNETKLEMMTLRMEKTKTGKITYNATKPYHDDVLDATCYSLKALVSGKYIIR